METQEKSMIENLSQFIRKSVTLKLISIFILMLILMIPMEFVRSLINEREQLNQSAIKEVSDKWANDQLIYGPVLTIPFNKDIMADGKITTVREEAIIFPSMLNIKGNVDPQILHRGIYDVVVYDSKVSFSGNFTGIDKYIAELKAHEILWDEATLTVNVSDLRGIKEKLPVKWNGSEIQVEPGSSIPAMVPSGFTVNNIFKDMPAENVFTFAFDLHLQGSQYLGFLPLGKETNVNLTSTWKDPSFTGSFLPDDRSINKDGFNATYKILELNRNYPQYQVGVTDFENIHNNAFGVNLLLPANDYQKAMRSAKYALLAISLTFLTFFLVEIFNRKRVHPFQYILIGLALCLFYTLLISISEYQSFGIAYIIASVSIIAMIGLYAKSIFENLKQTIMLVLVLALTYSFVYVTLMLEDYSLLIGSIGLTAILAFTMYITRNVNWYELSSGKKI